jgi:hypothetical protein
MGNAKKTVSYFKKQVSETVAVLPTSSTNGFIAIEAPDVTTGEREILNSDVLNPTIGMRKPQLGLETASASITMELRSHGDIVTPSEPDFGAIIESAIGTPNTGVTDTVQALPASSTTEMTFSTEGNVKKFDFVIVDNTTDGRVGRFVSSLKVAVIAGINDKIDFNEGGAELNATLTAGVYPHGSSSVVGSIGAHIKTQMEAVVGQTGTITVTAVEQANGSYVYTIANSTPSFALLIATGANTADAILKLNLGFGAVDLTGAVTYTAGTAVWGNRAVVSVPFTTAPTSTDDIFPAVNYKPLNEGHAHLTAGFYHGNSAVDGYLEQVIGALVSSLGITVDTASIAKMSAELQGLLGARTANTASPYLPDYEDVQGLTGFCVDLYLNNTRVDASSLAINIENEIVEKKSFKECSGKIGSIVRSRGVNGTLNPYADGGISYYSAIGNLTDFSVMLVIGKKDAGGFLVGQTVGVYLPQVMISSDKSSNIDDNMTEDLAFTAHGGINGDKLDIVLSFA